jgi:hypothetical protein
MIATQKDKNVEYEQNGTKVILKNCNALKLMATLFNKSGKKYTPEQMKKWGFDLR